MSEYTMKSVGGTDHQEMKDLMIALGSIPGFSPLLKTIRGPGTEGTFLDLTVTIPAVGQESDGARFQEQLKQLTGATDVVQDRAIPQTTLQIFTGDYQVANPAQKLAMRRTNKHLTELKEKITRNAPKIRALLGAHNVDVSDYQASGTGHGV